MAGFLSSNNETYKIKDIKNKVINGDAICELKKIPEKSINCLMTSPPYWALRDYGDGNSQIWDGDENCEHDFKVSVRKIHSGTTKSKISGNNSGHINEKKVEDNFCSKCGAWKGQLGLEPTFDLYIKHLCDIFDEVKRVLRDDGTCWVNMGDTYWGSGAGTQYEPKTENSKEVYTIPYNPHKNTQRNKDSNYQSKCLCMIPQRFAIEMVNRGWILRNTIIWHKPNCMPSSSKDRFTVDFEYIFFFSKKKKYYFEQQLEQLSESSLNDARLDKGREEHIGKSAEGIYGCNVTVINSKGRNKRTVWKIKPKPFKEAHFAVYPEELCETPIKAGCPEFVCKKCGNPKVKEFKRDVPTLEIHRNVRKGNRDRAIGGKYTKFMEDNPFKEKIISCNCNAGFTSGIVLDPFFGAGTTGLVALKQGKNFLGIELNKEYCKIAESRIKPFLEQEKL